VGPPGVLHYQLAAEVGYLLSIAKPWDAVLGIADVVLNFDENPTQLMC
jgi:hypothetical protein